MDLLGSPRRRRFLFFALYLSEGAPIGFLWWALPTILRSRGVPLAEITGLTALLVLPWTFKFLWAPVVDVLSGPRFGLRRWILASQALMGAALLPLTFFDAPGHLTALTLAALVHAFAAATQDVAIDALAIRSVPAKERGRINGWMQAGMLLGRGVFGGATLVVISWFGLRGAVLLLTVVIWSAGGLLLFTRDHAAGPSPPQLREAIARVGRALLDVAGRKETWAGLAFAAVAGAGFEAAGALAGPFLVDLGYTSAAIGIFFSVVTLPAMAAGALIGGRFADRLTPARVSAFGLLWLVASLLGLAAAESLGAPDASIPLLGLVYFGIGVFTAGSYSLFMQITDRRLGATQFSAFMGATNFCESWSGFAGGRFAGMMGYGMTFGMMGLLSLLAFPLLRRMAGAPRDTGGDHHS